MSSEYFQNSFRNAIRVYGSGMGPDQARHFVGLIWIQTICKGYQQRNVKMLKIAWFWVAIQFSCKFRTWNFGSVVKWWASIHFCAQHHQKGRFDRQLKRSPYWMLSALYVCCMYLNAPQKFYSGSKHYEPWSDCSLRSKHYEPWSDSAFLGAVWSRSILLTINQHMRKQTTIVVNVQVLFRVKMLTLKEPRKKMHLKILSAEVVCCKYLPIITDEWSIEANSVDPEQTAPIQSDLGPHCLP